MSKKQPFVLAIGSDGPVLYLPLVWWVWSLLPCLCHLAGSGPQQRKWQCKVDGGGLLPLSSHFHRHCHPLRGVEEWESLVECGWGERWTSYLILSVELVSRRQYRSFSLASLLCSVLPVPSCLYTSSSPQRNPPRCSGLATRRRYLPRIVIGGDLEAAMLIRRALID